MIEFVLPIRTISENNFSAHWTKKFKLHRDQKTEVKYYFLNKRINIQLPCTVKITRISPRKLDSDNLQGSLKWIRDAIAEQIIPGKAAGRADDDPRITWKYAQEKGKQGIKIAIYN
jgi:hypothetical protein